MNSNIRIAIVVSNYHKNITDKLLGNCVKTLKKKSISESQITIVRVPGSLEIPLAAKKLAQKRVYDAIIALGVIHKGETYHFELIATECARGCMQVMLDYEIPVIFEVLAVYDLKDAMERATRKKENRGIQAALSALEMVKYMRNLSIN